MGTPNISASVPGLTGAEWLAAHRAELKESVAQAQRERRVADRATRERRYAAILAAHVKRKAETPSRPEEIAKEQAKAERKRLRRKKSQHRYAKAHRKKLRNTPDAIRARQARKMRKYRRRRQQKAKHERWLKKLADAAAKKQTKAERRARREAIAAERAAARAIQGLPLVERKRTSVERRIQDAFNDGFREGVEAGRAMERAEKQAA